MTTGEEVIKKLAKEQVFPAEFRGCKSFGITKCELFAAMAMQGILSNADWVKSDKIPDDFDEYANLVAESSVKFSEALIAEIERTNKITQTTRDNF